jgi:hypothetical protein
VSKSPAFSDNIRAFGWPPILPTKAAAAYCNVSRWTIKRAAACGALSVAGRRGRETTFLRDELDRWLLGEQKAQGPSTTTTTRQRLDSSSTSDALTRLRAINQGSGR